MSERDLLAELARADFRWCRETADEPRDREYLMHLAVALRPLLPEQSEGVAAELRRQIREQWRLIGNLRADYAALKDETDQRLRRRGVA